MDEFSTESVSQGHKDRLQARAEDESTLARIKMPVGSFVPATKDWNKAQCLKAFRKVQYIAVFLCTAASLVEGSPFGDTLEEVTLTLHPQNIHAFFTELMGDECDEPDRLDVIEILEQLPLICLHYYLFLWCKKLSSMLMLWKGALSSINPPTFGEDLPDPATLTDPADGGFFEKPFTKKRTAAAAGLDLDGTMGKQDLFNLNAGLGDDTGAGSSGGVQFADTIADMEAQI